MGKLFEVVIVAVDESVSSHEIVQTVLAKVLQRGRGESVVLRPGEPVIVPGQLSESEAKRLRDTLQKFGIRSRLRPCIGDLSGLTLVPMDDQAELTRTRVCPDCGGSVEFQATDPEPEQCPHCGLVFSKHDHQVKEIAICERVVRRLRESVESQQPVAPVHAPEPEAGNGEDSADEK